MVGFLLGGLCVGAVLFFAGWVVRDEHPPGRNQQRWQRGWRQWWRWLAEADGAGGRGSTTPATETEMRARPRPRGDLYVLSLGLAGAAMVGWVLLFDDGGDDPNGSAADPAAVRPLAVAGATWESPRYALLNLEGTWMEADGVRGFRITATGAGGASAGGLLPGRVEFIPAAGDWAAPMRCGVSGAHLIVEIPAPSGTVVAKVWQIESINRASCRIDPWRGVYSRGER